VRKVHQSEWESSHSGAALDSSASLHSDAQSGVDLGTVHDGTYVNPHFDFKFTYPKDWTVHGKETDERMRELGKEMVANSGAGTKESLDVALKSTYTLLTVFRHPIGTPGITSNPAILIIAEKVSHAPGIKTGKDYLLNVREVMKRTGAQLLLDEPKECNFDGRQFFRDDFVVDVNGVKITQYYFAHVMKGYALVFLFTGIDQKVVDEMAKSMDTFEVTPPIRRGIKTMPGGAAPKPKP
jgi:hypothetical protein